MKAKLKISITDGAGEPFMGVGLVWLLTRVERFGSIRVAARDMGMSYVKALRILNTLERKLGRKIVVRRRGGMQRGGTELTPFAKEFIDRFARYLDKVNRYAQREFMKLFGRRQL